MAEKLEALLFGLGNAMGAIVLGYGVATGEIPPGLILLAALNAFVAVAFAAKLALLSTSDNKSGGEDA